MTFSLASTEIKPAVWWILVKNRFNLLSCLAPQVAGTLTDSSVTRSSDTGPDPTGDSGKTWPFTVFVLLVKSFSGWCGMDKSRGKLLHPDSCGLLLISSTFPVNVWWQWMSYQAVGGVLNSWAGLPPSILNRIGLIKGQIVYPKKHYSHSLNCILETSVAAITHNQRLWILISKYN